MRIASQYLNEISSISNPELPERQYLLLQQQTLKLLLKDQSGAIYFRVRSLPDRKQRKTI
jgi:hypothetical protein